MGAIFRLWWQQIKQHLVTIVVVAIILVVAIALIIVEIRFYGTGFAGKTLWDWLQLLAALAIPVVVGFGAVWFTTRQGKVADAENKDNQRETALQAYIDKMSELLLTQNLRNASEEEEGQNRAQVRTLIDLRGVPIRSGPMEAQKIARVRTLTVLRRLDAERKGSVLLFLYESGLRDKDRRIIDLKGADLRGADLSSANLSGAGLNLADLRYVNLSRADLSRADLEDAIGITTEELEKQAKSLTGATMPDGSIHP